MTTQYNAAAIRAVVFATLPECPVTVEHTGGGTATMYLGTRDRETGRAWLSIGPGAYDVCHPWDSTFWFGDDATSIGPDTEDGLPSSYPETLSQLVAYLMGARP